MLRPCIAGRVTDTDSHAFFLYNIITQSGESIGNDLPIMKENEKEELQSRRSFFKNAAKRALPFLGAIVLANAPILASASNSQMGCTRYGCGGCTGTCSGTCSGTCQTTRHTLKSA